MSKEDYEQDFELRYLIRSRVRSFLNSYSRTLYISNLSSLETNMQLKLKSIYGKLGLNFQYNNSRFSEKSLVINVIFYNVEEICVEHEVPLSADGYKLLFNKSLLNETEREKYQAHKEYFIERVMSYNDLKYAHKECLEDTDYLKIINDIKTYDDINKLIEFIHKIPKYTPINDIGIKILKLSPNYYQDMKLFLKKIFEKANIGSQYETLLRENESPESLNNFLDNITKMKHIHQIINKYLSNIDTSSLNRNGFEILNEYNVLSTEENRKKYLDRYIQEYNLDTGITEMIFKLNDEKLNKFFSDYSDFSVVKEPNFYQDLIDEVNQQSNLELVISETQTIDLSVLDMSTTTEDLNDDNIYKSEDVNLTTDDLVNTEDNYNNGASVDNPSTDTIKENKEETPIESNSKSSSKISNL
jgi:hypothetical protein